MVVHIRLRPALGEFRQREIILPFSSFCGFGVTRSIRHRKKSIEKDWNRHRTNPSPCNFSCELSLRGSSKWLRVSIVQNALHGVLLREYSFSCYDSSRRNFLTYYAQLVFLRVPKKIQPVGSSSTKEDWQ